MSGNKLIITISFLFYCLNNYGQNLPKLIPFNKDNKWGFADTSMSIVVEPIYDYVTELRNGYANVRSNNLFGLIDSTGRIVIPVNYNVGFSFYENHSWTVRNYRWIIIDINGNETIPDYRYYFVPKTFRSGYSRVYRDGKYGFVNTSGKEVIPCIYDSIGYSFEEGFAAVRLGKKWGYINKSEKVVIDFKYDYADDFQEGLARVLDYNKGYGYIDTLGNEVISLQFQDANPFYEGRAHVTVNNKIGFIDKQGNYIIKPKYKWCGNFQEGFAYLGTDIISRIYNRNGKRIKTYFGYSDIDYFSEGLAAVESRFAKCGYIDTTGKKVIKIKYEFANEFSCGFGAVELNNKNGFIDKKGNIVIPLIYDKSSDFFNGIAEVERNGRRFYIDTKGREFIEW